MQDVQEESGDAAKEFRGLIETGDAVTIAERVEAMSPLEVARGISRLEESDRTRFLELLGPAKAAYVLSKLSGIGAVALFGQIHPDQAGPIVGEMPSHAQATLLRTVSTQRAEKILRDVEPGEASRTRELMKYPENTAGALMITKYLSYDGRQPVKDVLDDMRQFGEEYSDYDVQYAYVVSGTGVLTGVLRLRDLLMAARNRPIEEIMIRNPLKLDVGTPLRTLRDFFRQHTLLGVPITNEQGKLVGVVRATSVREAATRQSSQLFLKFAGIVGGEELRTMSLFRRSSRRLSWLSINIVLNIVAASVIALYQDTLEKAIVLAVFLPIISDMSGCSGNQAVAVSIRELTLGLVRPTELLRILAKEASIGLINGVVLGLLLGMTALLWKGNPYLGLVVGASLAANTLVAVCFGGLIPLVLRWMKNDPALASGPLLTTITDMCGFFFVLSFASALLPRLSGLSG
jgi:magnesium transporter